MSSNRDELLFIVKKKYEELSKSNRKDQSSQEKPVKKTIINQGSETIPVRALSKMKANQMPSDDGIVIDAIKPGDKIFLEKIKDLFNICLLLELYTYQVV